MSNANVAISKATGTGTVNDDDRVDALTLNFDGSTNLFTVEGSFFLLGKATFQLVGNETSFLDEVGVFRVDDQNRVTDLLTSQQVAPREPNYLRTALESARVIFSALPDSTQLGFERLQQELQVSGGDKLVFYLVPNSTTKAVLNNQTPLSSVLVGGASTDRSSTGLQVIDKDNGEFTLSWEDGDTDERDFNDLVLDLRLTSALVEAPSRFQGVENLIDLTGLTYPQTEQAVNGVDLNFTINSEAAYDNFVGLYRVDDDQGAIDHLVPGDPAYAQAALTRQVTGFNNRTQTADAQLSGEAIGLLAPFIIANGSITKFLEQNPDNQSGKDLFAYFPFINANPDKVDHIRLLGINTFGIEDLPFGDDADFNDTIFQVNLTLI